MRPRYRRPPPYPRQGTNPWTIVGWLFLGGLLMIILQVIVGTCGLAILVNEAMRQSSY